MAVEADPSRFGTFESQPDYYIEFLDARTAMLEDERRVKQLIMGLLEPQKGLDVLDVGAGTGDDARQIATLVAPGGKVVGVDRSADMVSEARRRADDAGLPVEFVEGDAQELDFADGSFDRCRAERVLSHLPDPVTAVREMVRVTRPGGIVVVSDLDTGTLFINSSNEALATSLALGLTDDLASRWVGRRLHGYFVEVGLEDVRCVPTVVQNSVAFTRMVFANRLRHMVDTGEATVDEVADFWAELEDGERRGGPSSGVTCFNAVGRKPS